MQFKSRAYRQKHKPGQMKWYRAEVLLFTKPFIEDDAMVKIKAAAELHPYKFILI